MVVLTGLIYVLLDFLILAIPKLIDYLHRVRVLTSRLLVLLNVTDLKCLNERVLYFLAGLGGDLEVVDFIFLAQTVDLHEVNSILGNVRLGANQDLRYIWS